jgi:hypothetical protein
METINESPEFTLAHREIVPIDEARFLDQLEDGLEDNWTTLVTNLVSSGINYRDKLMELWKDNEIPRVFRDRSLIILLSPENLPKNIWPAGPVDWIEFLSIGSKDNNYCGPYLLNNVSDEDKGEVYQSVQDLFEYQTSNNLNIVSKNKLAVWWCNQYENNIIDLKQFENNISKLLNTNSDDNERVIYQKTDLKFPILSNIIESPIDFGDASPRVEVGGDKLKKWAKDQSKLWLEYVINGNEDIPKWLKQVPKENGISLIKQTVGYYDDVLPLINELGWEEFIGDYIYTAEKYFEKTKNDETRISLAKFVMNKYLELKESPGYTNMGPLFGNIRLAEIIQRISDKSKDTELKNFVENEKLSLLEFKQQCEIQRNMISEKQLQREIERTAETIERNKALKSFNGLLNILKSN